jgi:hypothetical protein
MVHKQMQHPALSSTYHQSTCTPSDNSWRWCNDTAWTAWYNRVTAQGSLLQHNLWRQHDTAWHNGIQHEAACCNREAAQNMTQGDTINIVAQQHSHSTSYHSIAQICSRSINIVMTHYNIPLCPGTAKQNKQNHNTAEITTTAQQK